jgi:hypothetical protein
MIGTTCFDTGRHTISILGTTDPRNHLQHIVNSLVIVVLVLRKAVLGIINKQSVRLRLYQG